MCECFCALLACRLHGSLAGHGMSSHCSGRHCEASPGCGTEPGSPERADNAQNCWVISLAQDFCFLCAFYILWFRVVLTVHIKRYRGGEAINHKLKYMCSSHLFAKYLWSATLYTHWSWHLKLLCKWKPLSTVNKTMQFTMADLTIWIPWKP